MPIWLLAGTARPQAANSDLCQRVRRGEINADEGTGIIKAFEKMPLEIASSKDNLSKASELAILTSQSVYDCLYLSLAIERRCQLITADQRFINSLATTPLAKCVCALGRSR